MWWQGAQIIFSPHYNRLPHDHMDNHRIRVRNKHIGTAALLACRWCAPMSSTGTVPGQLGYGDSAIFDAIGQPLAEAGLFRETLITADVSLKKDPLRRMRQRLPMEVRKTLSEQMLKARVTPF